MIRSSIKTACFSLALSLAPSASFAISYTWLSWNFPTSTTATANAGALGTISVAVQSSSSTSVSTNAWQLQFDNVSFTPVLAPAVGAQNTIVQTWSIDVDLSAISDSSQLVIGLGNFGHSGNYPGYQLSALDTSNNPINLATLSVIGSHDHTWISPTSAQFNDDLSLNPVTGDFSATTVPGLDDLNSDIMLFGLPSNVGLLTVATIGDSAGDTVNVVAGIVPEPGTASLVALGLVSLVRRSRNRSRSEANRR